MTGKKAIRLIVANMRIGENIGISHSPVDLCALAILQHKSVALHWLENHFGGIAAYLHGRVVIDCFVALEHRAILNASTASDDDPIAGSNFRCQLREVADDQIVAILATVDDGIEADLRRTAESSAFTALGRCRSVFVVWIGSWSGRTGLIRALGMDESLFE